MTEVDPMKIRQLPKAALETPTIRRMALKDVHQAAILHMDSLRSNMRGNAGRRLLACYYQSIALKNGGTGFVAVDNEDNISGFVCGIWNQREVNSSMLKRSWWRLLIWGGLHVLLHPTLIRYYLARITKKTLTIIEGGEVEHDDGRGLEHDDTYELRPLVVSSKCRGQGVATLLVGHLISDAKKRGHRNVFLVTEIDNDRANAFYVKHGFFLGATNDGLNKYHIHIDPENFRTISFVERNKSSNLSVANGIVLQESY